MKRFQRKKLLVDHQVQLAFLLRAVGYWLTSLISAVLLLMITSMLAAPARLVYPGADSPWFHLGPTVLCSLLLLPIVVYDFLRLSNRLVGPVFRLRRAMRELAAGKHVEPIHFRDGDFWRDFAGEFNAVAQRVHASGGCCAERRCDEPADERLVSAAS